MITLDEEIVSLRKSASKSLDYEWQREQCQIAERLEELKDLREMRDAIESNANTLEQNGYNKAIDDFKKILTIEKIKEYAESDGFININNCSLMIFNIAEQLKVGRENE